MVPEPPSDPYRLRPRAFQGNRSGRLTRRFRLFAFSAVIDLVVRVRPLALCFLLSLLPLSLERSGGRGQAGSLRGCCEQAARPKTGHWKGGRTFRFLFFRSNRRTPTELTRPSRRDLCHPVERGTLVFELGCRCWFSRVGRYYLGKCFVLTSSH